MHNQLSHHGVKGQKWGVRRYQNEDGTLTPAGRKQITKSAKKADLKDAKKLVRKDNFKRNMKATGVVLGVAGVFTLAGIKQESNRRGVKFSTAGKDFIDALKNTGKFASDYVLAGKDARSQFKNMGR